MSRINRLRIINLRYNHDSIQIGDEQFDFNGQNTLMTLRNGGGKTVLVQMMMAPFVHRRYRDLADRPFASYFTSSKPAFILVEWKLDGGGGYVLTGMMVRRSQDTESPEELEITNFIFEYPGGNAMDLEHIPVTEKSPRGEILKGYVQCRQLFDTWKKEPGTPFFCYDMNQPAQARQYFEKLADYDIYYREWEAIIHKVNLEESGLSNLFADCKNESGLVEKWLLDTVEKKLNRGTDSMKEFRSIMGKYAVQYKDNRSKIQRRDTIEIFRQQAQKVRSGAEVCRKTEQEMEEQENAIASFRDTLSELLRIQAGKEENLRQQEQAIADEMTLLRYQKYSAEIVKNTHEQAENQSVRERLNDIRERLAGKRKNTERRQHLLACAKQQEELNEASQDLAETEEQLRILRDKDRDLAPEREKVGSRLAGYYTEKLKDSEAEQKEKEKELRQMEADRTSARTAREEAEKARQQLAGELGAMKERIRSYDEAEERFNRRYHASLSRNVLGEYEEGALTEAKLSWQDQKKKLEQDQKEAFAGQANTEQEMEAVRRRLEDVRRRRTILEENIRQAKERKDEYDRELSERRGILRYFEIPEEELFNTASILEAADSRLQKNEEVRKNMAVTLHGLEREYRQLSGGEVIELSEDFRRMLEEAGISCLYGMEWLARNQNTESQNRKLVQQYPFLPYSLLMSASEADRLRHLTVRTNTSAPIPILIREDMAQGAGSAEAETGNGNRPGGPNLAKAEQVIDFDHVSFYLCFNDALLNRKKLREMVEAKAQEIRRVKEDEKRKADEYRMYYEQRGILANQKVTGEEYEKLKAQMEALRESAAASSRQAEQMQRHLDELSAGLKEYEKIVREKSEQIRKYEILLEDFETLCKEYKETLEVLRRRHKAQEQDKKLEKMIADLRIRQGELENAIRSADMQKNSLLQKIDRFRQAALEFAFYAAAPGSLTEEEAVSLKARYEAITSRVSGEQKELEKKIKRQSARKQKKQKELDGNAAEYGFSAQMWQNVSYDQAEELRLQKEAAAYLEQMQQTQAEIMVCEKKAGALEERKKTILANMLEDAGRSDPLPEEDIPAINFDEAIATCRHDAKTKAEEVKEAEDRRRMYDENLTALAEFDNLKRREETPLDDTMEGMSGALIKKRQGELKRGYVHLQDTLRKNREETARTIGGIMRDEKLQEDFFQKPLETLQSLTDSAEQLQNQLDIILGSFDQLIEKLLIDISLVDKEKARIAGMMEDYLHHVSTDLGKIDDNSTIMIREHPVKMLKIGTPDWEENASMYQIRLKDYMDDVTDHCVGLLEENRNIEEYLGARITTKALYDAVIGIGNVTVRLYKIEADREYPITWSEVARNSGGEGFLSAFVILTSLLYYLRRNDSDVFAEKKETKVLIMDNPFAQTNASHLLIPLMDVARKSGTQLICLTGLGGESIYNRFDNIYVLNLYSSSLRSGMRYLKAEHERGSADESMMVSNVRVTGEQMRLF